MYCMNCSPEFHHTIVSDLPQCNHVQPTLYLSQLHCVSAICLSHIGSYTALHL